jgi:hypothetical protein
VKIAFDVGGVLSKYPRHFTRLMEALRDAGHELHVISDMHPREKILEALRRNGFLLTGLVAEGSVHSADYANYGEACKAALCRDLGIDALVDDFPGYLVWPWPGPAPLRLLVQPDPYRPYWSALWGTDDEQEFGRRVYSPSRLAGLEAEPADDSIDEIEAERDTYKAQLDACLTRIDQLKQEREALRDDNVKRKADCHQACAALMTAVRQLAWHHDERDNPAWFRSRLLSLLALVLRPDEAECTAIKLDRFERIVQGTEPPVLPADVEEDYDPADNEPVIPKGFTDARIAQPDTDRTVQIAHRDGSSASWDLGFYDAPSGETRKVWWRHSPMRQLADGVVASWKELPKSAKEGPKSGVELHRGCISGPSSGAIDAPIVRAEPRPGPPKEDS